MSISQLAKRVGRGNDGAVTGLRPSGQQKRSVNLAGHATSLALEPEFWAVLEAIASSRDSTLATLIQEIDARRGRRPLASACRLAALEFAGRR